jgi:cellulose synthase/poly-beta-1,6-N-acetylglucosamine synthase-like glycosyltransferase
MLFWAFVASASALWLLTCGYLLLLTALARRAPAPSLLAAADWPEVAVVVPTRNEAGWIEAKLRDLAALDVPRARLRSIVVDRGSQDGTLAIVERAIAAGARVSLESVPWARSRAEQLNHVLGTLTEEFVVLTDADTRLEPGCVPALIALLVASPHTPIVGALVRPESGLIEERLHWRIVNRLWWLEGEALSATGLSGVCYAVRRSALPGIKTDTRAEDVQLALAVGAGGGRARICPGAVATELRVPQTSLQLLTYRRRRGQGFLDELKRRLPPPVPGRVRLFRRMRLLQFGVGPALLCASVVSGVLVSLTPDRGAVALAALLFAFIAPWAVRGIPGTTCSQPLPWTWPFAVCRLAVLLSMSLIAAPRKPLVEENVGCSEPVI